MFPINTKYITCGCFVILTISGIYSCYDKTISKFYVLFGWGKHNLTNTVMLGVGRPKEIPPKGYYGWHKGEDVPQGLYLIGIQTWGSFFECKRENFPKLFLTTENVMTHLF